jgi:L-iduronidase
MTTLSRREALARAGVGALVGAAAPSHAGAPAHAAAAVSASSNACARDLATITVDGERVVGAVPKFWRCTGFTPAELLLLPEMRQTLAFLGAIPNRGIEFVRTHYLLDLVVRRPGAALSAYDWGLLEEALDTLVDRGLRPFFELMGNPSNIFHDFGDTDQLFTWRDLVAELASRCIGRYGRDEVRTWWFETWNEPDLPFWRWGEQGYLNYVDACRAGLDAVDPTLRFGGPGTAFTLSPMFRRFLAHCDDGLNAFTGERGVRLDFISVHEKGSREHVEDLTPRTLGIIERELRAVDYIRARHPRMAGLPFINNECDPETGWLVPHTYRALPYYAALIAKVVDQHQRLLVDAAGVDCAILSNDNGFIGRFGHRTHLTYFGRREIRKAQAEHRTDVAAVQAARAEPMPFELVKKPALAVMEMLALLGPERCAATSDVALDPDVSGLGVLATRLGQGRIAVLLYNSVDRIWASGERRASLVLSNLRPGEYGVATVRLDHVHGDAFHLWDAWQAPDLPEADQFFAMRAAAEPAVSFTRESVSANRLALDLTLLLPSVTLVVAERIGGAAPGRPTRLRADPQPGLTERENVLLTWTPGVHAGLQTFDVLSARSAGGSFERVNPSPLLSAAFLHVRQPGACRYVIEARTLNGSVRPQSDPIEA